MRTLIRERKELLPEPVGLFPLDEGPFGVRDLGGGMREMTSAESDNDKQWRIFKGGAWSGERAICRCAALSSCDPEYMSAFLGFRLLARRTP